MNTLDRAIMRLTERLQLNPSGWLPAFRTPKEGVYQAAYPILSREEIEEGGLEGGMQLDHSRPSYHPFMNGYELLWSWSFHRRQERTPDRPEGLCERLWSFLFDVSCGMYDTTNWLPVDPGTRTGEPE